MSFIVTIGVVVLILLMVTGIPVAFAFLGSASIMAIVGGYSTGFMVPYGFAKINSIILLAMPMFILSWNSAVSAKSLSMRAISCSAELRVVWEFWSLWPAASLAQFPAAPRLRCPASVLFLRPLWKKRNTRNPL